MLETVMDGASRFTMEMERGELHFIVFFASFTASSSAPINKITRFYHLSGCGFGLQMGYTTR
jgi:hypothetical protein